MTIRIDGTNTTANPGITGTDTDTGLQFGTDEVSIVTGGTERLKVDSSGNVGIGQSSPNALLEVNSATAGNEVQRIEGSYTGSGSVVLSNWRRAGGAVAANLQYYDSPIIMSLGTSTSHDFALKTNDSERMRIRSDGNIGIGTAGSSNTQLYVYGAGTNQAIYGQANGSGSSYGVYGYCVNGNSTQYGVYGQVGTSSSHSSAGVLAYSINNNTYGIIGYWSTAAYYSFYGNGNIAGTAFTNVSDSRLKDVDSNLTGCLDKLANIQPVKYTWKENSQQRRSVGEGLEIGLLAQEVQAQFPELVCDMEWPEITGANPETLNEQLGTTLGVDYGRMTAVLVQALNEAKVRIETLETQNVSLEARLTALEGGAS